MAIAPSDAPPTLVTSTQLDDVLNSKLPVLLLVWNGETLRAEIKTELENAVREHEGRIRVVKADASKSTEFAKRFELGKHPLLIGLHNGEILARRPRPWKTDVQGMVEMLLTHAPAADPKKKEKLPAENKPVAVTDKTFQKEVLESPLPVLVDFWAEWCGPCKQVAPILEKLSTEFAGKIRIAKVDVDANPGLTQAFRIMSIPTLMFVKNGKIVGQQAGALPEHILRNAIQQLVNLTV
jgi:thioredoxin 1